MRKDRNARHLLVLISCCLMAASSVGIFTNSVGVFYTPVSSALNVGHGAFALHATLCNLVMGFLSPLTAKLLQKVPFRILVIGGSILAAGSTALMAGAGNIWAFYALGILRGIGMTTFSLLPVTTLINNWYQKKHGLAVGIALSFSGLSGAIFSPLLSSLIRTIGWRGAFLVMSGIGFILTVPGMIFLCYRPEQTGILPYGGSQELSVLGSSISEKTVSKEKIYTPALVILSLMTLLHTSVTGIAQHFPGMGERMGFGTSVGAMMVSAGMIGNIVSKLIIGTVSDRIGPFKASVSMIMINAAALLGLLLYSGKTAGLMYGFAFFYGTVYSVGAVGIPLLTRKLFGSENYTSAYSVITVFTSIGSASSLTVIGLIYDLTGGYSAALIGGITIDAINLIILIALLRIHKHRQAAALSGTVAS